METTHKQIVVGILAHVDSGKTTLSEAMLYRAGAIRKLGRVDHKDAFLDTDALEKARGITIFSKQALLTAGGTDITLLDTPGHVDFSTETERTLQVLDYAVLVISGTDGVQSHTETLWRLLRRYHVPTFVFVNKMDLPGPGRENLLIQLARRLGEGFVDFGAAQADRDEALALCDERLMDRMLDAGQLTDADIVPAIARRHVFPCWFGSALKRTETDKLEAVDALLEGLDRYTRPAPALDAFGAKVFKVSQDEQGTRLTWLRVTGGTLKVKAPLTGEADGEPWAEKANQLRHVRFLKDAEGLAAHMSKHAAILRPKFERVLSKLDEGLSEVGGCSWSRPRGGYFVSFDAPEGTAKRIVQLAKEAGVTMTGAGATWPYKHDPHDSNIRIAPTLPPLDELDAAMDVFVCCVKLAFAEKLLQG